MNSSNPIPFVSGRVVNLSQLRDSICPVSPFLKAQSLFLLLVSPFLKAHKLSLFLLCVALNVWRSLFDCFTLISVSPLTIVLRNRLVISEPLFEGVFGTKFFGVNRYMNVTWPNEFEVTLEGAKVFTVFKSHSQTFYFVLRLKVQVE